MGVWAHWGSLCFRPSGPVRDIWLIGRHGPVLSTVCSVLPYQVCEHEFDRNGTHRKTETNKRAKRTSGLRFGSSFGKVFTREPRKVAGVRKVQDVTAASANASVVWVDCGLRYVVRHTSIRLGIPNEMAQIPLPYVQYEYSIPFGGTVNCGKFLLHPYPVSVQSVFYK